LKVRVLFKPGFFFDFLTKCLSYIGNFYQKRKSTRVEILCDDLVDGKAFWILLKCNKCDTKRIPMVNKGKIIPVNRYCKNCGSERFYLERKEDIERLDTIYALYSKDLTNVRPARIKFYTAQLHQTLKAGTANAQQLNISQRELNNNIL
jgi:hypothetical protein